jgi:hypothetical protein
MKKSLHKLLISLLILFGALIVTGCHSPLTMGRWNEDGNYFSNTWSGFSFHLPEGLYALSPTSEQRHPPPPLPFSGSREVEDFTVLTAENNGRRSSVVLRYVDVSSGERRNHSAEDYLNIIHQMFIDNPSPRRTRTLIGDFETATIGAWEYTVMRWEVVEFDESVGTYYQDTYAFRWVNTMVVFIVTYDDGTKHLTDRFLSAINQSWQ